MTGALRTYGDRACRLDDTLFGPRPWCWVRPYHWRKATCAPDPWRSCAHAACPDWVHRCRVDTAPMTAPRREPTRCRGMFDLNDWHDDDGNLIGWKLLGWCHAR